MAMVFRCTKGTAVSLSCDGKCFLLGGLMTERGGNGFLSYILERLECQSSGCLGVIPRTLGHDQYVVPGHATPLTKRVSVWNASHHIAPVARYDVWILSSIVEIHGLPVYKRYGLIHI